MYREGTGHEGGMIGTCWSAIMKKTKSISVGSQVKFKKGFKEIKASSINLF